MKTWIASALLITVSAAGCSPRSTATQTRPASRPATRASEEPSSFFADPKVAALAAALEPNDWTGAEDALYAGADVNAIGKDGIYPLVWAMYIKNKAAFDWLLNHGADPNFDSGGDNGCALIWAAKANDPDWLRMLLAHKANPNLMHKTAIWTETPLLAAVSPPSLANVKMLIAAGADINYQLPKQDGGGTPAINAAQVGFFEGVYVLLEAGADIRPRTTGGFDLTSFVAGRQLHPGDQGYPWRDKVLQLLRERGADVDGALKAASDAAARDRIENPWRYR